MFNTSGNWAVSVVVSTTILLALSVIPFLVFNWASNILHGPTIAYPFVVLAAALLSGSWGVSFFHARTTTPQ